MIKKVFYKLIINYLRILSYIKLKYFYKGKVIAVAGCFGKSSAINILENIFRSEYKIYTSMQDGKGLNTETGIPFIILNIHPKTYSIFDWLKYCVIGLFGLFKKIDQDFLLLELGIDKPNDMKYFVSFIKPNLGILLNSNNTHSAMFEDLKTSTKLSFEELIAKENGYIFQESKDGILYNLDDPEVVSQINRFKGENKISFSAFTSNCILYWKVSVKGTEIKIKYLDKEYSFLHKEALLDEYRETFAMALKAGEFYDLKSESILNGLKNFTLPPSRCSLYHGVNKSFIIDSSYNSAFVPAASALKLLNEISVKRKVAILGDMRELGVLSEKEHRKLAHEALKENIDVILTVGPNMKEYFYDEFINIKKEAQEIISFDKTKDCLEFISKSNFEFINKDDVILIKSSQNTLLLEIIVEALLENKSESGKLCRRGELYDKERAKLLK